jgi:hypothetical protein
MDEGESHRSQEVLKVEKIESVLRAWARRVIEIRRIKIDSKHRSIMRHKIYRTDLLSSSAEHSRMTLESLVER